MHLHSRSLPTTTGPCFKRSCLLAAYFAATALAAPAPHDARARSLRARHLVNAIDQSYDFVVVGGGLAGLVLGARLSEDSQHKVLVLEAGSDDRSPEILDQMNIPGNTYYKSLWGTEFNWAFKTIPQSNANNKEVSWPRGKVLGGSGAINGLYMNRPGELEVNDWHDLLGTMDGADNWTWGTLFAAMKKSETFNPPSDDIAQRAGITYDVANHGTSGPIHQSFPGYTFPQVGQWTTALNNIGVTPARDTYGGQNWGAYIANSAINPTNWTRSYSRSGYLDPLPDRTNYHVLPRAHVSRITFDSASSGTLTANGVQFSLDGGQTLTTVRVNKEVILAAGAVGSPHILMNSGVGPRDVLTGAGVSVTSELPGVGQHLQDHCAVAVQYSTDQPTMGSVYAAGGPETSDPVYMSFVNSATAYVNLTTMVGSDGVGAFRDNVASMYDAAVPNVPSTDPTVLAGYKAIYDKKIARYSTPTPQIELLLAINGADAVRLTSAIMNPLSHGQIYINSSNPFDPPVIDPRYLSHPADVTMLREAAKMARRLGQAEPYNGFTGEVAPGADVETDEAWEAWMRPLVSTEFHPTSTCAMLPRNLGGVVDANLRVYGISNVRVADSSVLPISFGAHTMGPTYGLAEQASNIIRAEYSGNGPTTGGTGTSGGPGSQQTDKPDAALTLSRPTGTLALAAVFALALLL